MTERVSVARRSTALGDEDGEAGLGGVMAFVGPGEAPPHTTPTLFSLFS